MPTPACRPQHKAEPQRWDQARYPLFMLGKAKVTVTPCMNLDDLKKGIEESAAQMQAMQGQSAQ